MPPGTVKVHLRVYRIKNPMDASLVVRDAEPADIKVHENYIALSDDTEVLICVHQNQQFMLFLFLNSLRTTSLS